MLNLVSSRMFLFVNVNLQGTHGVRTQRKCRSSLKQDQPVWLWKNFLTIIIPRLSRVVAKKKRNLLEIRDFSKFDHAFSADVQLDVIKHAQKDNPVRKFTWRRIALRLCDELLYLCPSNRWWYFWVDEPTSSYPNLESRRTSSKDTMCSALPGPRGIVHGALAKTQDRVSEKTWTLAM